eukprot:jgi/Hompol1/6545/HPOL_003565-RA
MSSAQQHEADASDAAALYNTDRFLNTPLVSPIPPPDIHILRELVAAHKTRSLADQQTFRTDVQIPHELSVSWLARDQRQTDRELTPDRCLLAVGEAKAIDPNLFCDALVIEQLIDTKTKIASLNREQLAAARDAANPYEAIGKSLFINRAAVKIASLDTLFGFSRTHGLEFADLCSGPGGFTEYILWRKWTLQEPVHGWGITLRGDQDFQLDQMILPPEILANFEPHYGVDASGDLYNDNNIVAFSQAVMEKTRHHGVDLVMADGGFSVLGDEIHQEEHSVQLMLCQILTMFRILKKGGSFVIKSFEILSPVTAELVYMLYSCFTRITVVKPLASRPANSERYIVCESLIDAFPKTIIAHLHACNAQLNGLRREQTAAISAHVQHQPGFMMREEKIRLGLHEVVDILDRNWMLQDERFVDYLQASNMKYVSSSIMSDLGNWHIYVAALLLSSFRFLNQPAD